MLDEMLALAAQRAGGVAWEYYFTFGGGQPPWVSGLAEGTASRRSRAPRRGSTARPRSCRSPSRRSASSSTPTPTGVRVPRRTATTTRIYSFAPGLRVLNGFIQSLVGLYDYARLSKDPLGTQLFQAGEPEARVEMPTYDTGAWSLYSRGTSTHESTLSYHDLLEGFLAGLCTRTKIDVYCTTAEHFVDLQERAARSHAAHGAPARRQRTAACSFELSKVSRVTLQITRGARTVETRPFGSRRLRQAHLRLAGAAQGAARTRWC